MLKTLLPKTQLFSTPSLVFSTLRTKTAGIGYRSLMPLPYHTRSIESHCSLEAHF